MGLGQTILTILSLMLMGRLIISMNTSTLNAGVAKDLAEYRISGISLGISLLEQINSLSFDEATVNFNQPPGVNTNFTDASKFGLSKGETNLDDDNNTYNEASISDADDIDDYNNYTVNDTIKENGAIYKLKATIQYADTTGTAITSSSTKSPRKIVTVEVTSDYLIDYSVEPPRPDTLRFQSLYGYWFFR